jgi:sortase A
MRRLAGLLLLLGGVAILGAAGWQYAQGWLARDRARAAWAQVEARRARLAANERLGETVSGPVPPGTPVARLVIPTIGLDEVIVEGVGNGELNSNPGHLPGTPLPGLSGNAVISAHRDLHFRRLGRLRVGDTLSTLTERHAVTWRVTERRIVGANDPALFQTPGRALTLTTCWPIRLIGPAPDRLLLTAIPVDSVVRPAAPAVAVTGG